MGTIFEHRQFLCMDRSSREATVKFWEYSIDQTEILLKSLKDRYAAKYPKKIHLTPLAKSTMKLSNSTMKLSDVRIKDIHEAKIAITKENNQLKAKITENSKKLQELDSQLEEIITKENKQKALQKQRLEIRKARLAAEGSSGSYYDRTAIESEVDDLLGILDSLLERYQ